MVKEPRGHRVNAAVAAYRQLGGAEDDEQWLAHLTAWRKTLCDERMQIKSPIRDPKVKGVEQNLAVSIKAIDRGKAMFDHSQWELENSRLGQVMLEAGYEVTGADPSRNYGGQLPWHGSMSEVEKRLTTLADQRARAEAALEAALLTDEERAAQEAAAKQLRDAFNNMRVKHGPDASEPRLVAYRNGEVLPLDEMTPLERQAFEAADAAFRAEQRPREASEQPEATTG